MKQIKTTHTGYGVAYERADVTFVSITDIALDLHNLRYMVKRELPFESQEQAFSEVASHRDVLSLRRDIDAGGLAVPVEVIAIPGDQPFKVYNGNRRLVALRLLKEENGFFTEVPVVVIQALEDPDVRRDYLLRIHGPVAQRNWSTPARWAEPYRLYKDAHMSFMEIGKRYAMSPSTVAKNILGFEVWVQYRTWLWKTHMEDPRLGVRLAVFSAIRQDERLYKWFKSAPEYVFRMTMTDKLQGCSGKRNELFHILQNTRLHKILEVKGFVEAYIELLKSGFQRGE